MWCGVWVVAPGGSRVWRAPAAAGGRVERGEEGGTSYTDGKAIVQTFSLSEILKKKFGARAPTWFSVVPLESLYIGKPILSQNTQYSISILRREDANLEVKQNNTLKARNT